jgi:hypothetical protein
MTFASGQEPKYRYYRYFGKAKGSCMVGEVAFRGVEVIDDNSSTYSSCPIELILNGSASPISIGGTVTYSSTNTPLLTSISPRYGTVKGGEEITFTGSNFATDTTLYSILLDGKSCAITSATTTQVKCITAPRPGLYPETSLDIKITGEGNVAT